MTDDQPAPNQTTPKPYWTCRKCEHPQWCDREQKCCDILLSEEYYVWCLSERRDNQRG